MSSGVTFSIPNVFQNSGIGNAGASDLPPPKQTMCEHMVDGGDCKDGDAGAANTEVLKYVRYKGTNFSGVQQASFHNDALFPIEKKLLRQQFAAIRNQLPLERRREASEGIIAQLDLNQYAYVLSFSSLPQEIDLKPLNHKLARENRLLLPRVCGTDLSIYRVANPEEELELSTLKIWEPIIDRCQLFPIEQISCVLVPGLSFDRHKQRIGYGKGYYDRFLHQLKSVAPQAITICVGFREQFFEGELPCEEHDVALDLLCLT